MSLRPDTLAARLGRTTHVSPLRMKLLRLWQRQPGDAAELEDWLVDLANTRGARIVTRNPPPRLPFSQPSEADLTTAELVIGLLLPQNLDRPQMLRLAAQCISAGAMGLPELKSIAVQERVGALLAALAAQALRVEPEHALWQGIADAFRGTPTLREPLLHYTRLAEPVPVNGRVNAQSWRLVA